MKHERPYLRFQLNDKIVIRPLCGGRVFELAGSVTPINYLDQRERKHWQPEVRLRPVEVEALKAWLSLYTPYESKTRGPDSLTLSGVIFEIDGDSYERKSLSTNAIEAMEALGFNNDNPFEYVPDRGYFYHRDLGIKIIKSSEGDGCYLVDVLLDIEQRWIGKTTLSQSQAYLPLSHAAVTLADRLMGIISMQTAPDKGYDVVLRNGIGELSLLQSTDRLALSQILEDLIR